MKQIILIVIWICFVHVNSLDNSSEDDSCKWVDDLGQHYDLTDLSKDTGYWQVDLHETEQQPLKQRMKFNLCKNLAARSCVDDGEVIEYSAYSELVLHSEKASQSSDACTGFGRAEKQLIEQLDFYEPGVGVKVISRGGEICSESENLLDVDKERTVTFQVYCSNVAGKKFRQLPIDGIAITSCHPTFSIRHPAGCSLESLLLEIKNQSYFPFGIFVLCFFVILMVVFCVITTIFNRIEYGQTGFTALPFYQFIKSISIKHPYREI